MFTQERSMIHDPVPIFQRSLWMLRGLSAVEGQRGGWEAFKRVVGKSLEHGVVVDWDGWWAVLTDRGDFPRSF